jgi:5-methylcytosine-specific restriction endonuclease McrA
VDTRIADLDTRLGALSREFDSLWTTQSEGQKEIDERKRLYYELRLINAVRKRRRDEATRSMAAAHASKIRSSSQSLKLRSLRSVDEPICPYCKSEVEATDLVLDHIYPVSKGGLGTTPNTVLVCVDCNSWKGAKTLADFCEIADFDFLEVRARLKALGKTV